MAQSPKIKSDDFNIEELFKDFYSVPDFQREYVWQKENVEKLLNDIFEALYENDTPLKDTEYFLGSIVVYKDEEDNFQLIDGQQRMTTIYLIFCVLRNLFTKLDEKFKIINQLITNSKIDRHTHNEVTRCHIILQYDTESEKILKEVAENSNYKYNIPKKQKGTILSSSDNINIAIKTIDNWFSNKLPLNSESLRAFTCTFITQVKLIRIETPNLNNALRVFETINNTGVGLNAADLLKNYLFVNIAKNHDNNLKKVKSLWSKLIDKLYKCNQKPGTFLRYYLMSSYDVDLSNMFPEEEVYKWLTDDKNKHYVQNNPIEFIEKLVLASEHYYYFVNDKNIDGTNNQYLSNIRRMQGGYKQHYVLLLAGRCLPIDIFTFLCRHIECLLFTYAITGNSGRKDINLVRTFAISSRTLRKIKEEKELKEFINKYFYEEIIERLSLVNYFDVTFSKFNEGMVGKQRLRYIVAKIAQYVEKQAYGTEKQLNWYLDKKHHLEHILSKSNKNSDFDLQEQYSDYCKKLGNLTLLEEAINTSISDKHYESKKVDYAKSQFLITKSIAEIQKIGDDTKFNRAIDKLKLHEFKNWDSDSINKRQQIMGQIAKKVWGLE